MLYHLFSQENIGSRKEGSGVGAALVTRVNWFDFQVLFQMGRDNKE